jgi:hypothetical protein
LLQREDYRNWRDAANGSVLWTNGKAGSGKTILGSVVIEDLQARFCSAHDTTAVIYFFIDANDMAKRTSLGFAKSAILQLMPRLPKATELLSEYQQTTGGRWYDKLESSRPTCSGLMDVLQSACATLDRVLFVVDAIDELVQVDDMLTTVQDICKWSSTKVHMFMTGRQLGVIEDGVSSLSGARIFLGTDINESDISTYINVSVERMSRLKNWSRELTKEVKEVLSHKANGS